MKSINDTMNTNHSLDLNLTKWNPNKKTRQRCLKSSNNLIIFKKFYNSPQNKNNKLMLDKIIIN